MERDLEFRTLQTEELTQWFCFVASVFNIQNIDIDYFVRHWQHDPHKAINGIFVCVSDKKIVSTVRVFHRSIYVNGRELKMGGIGEVSTAPEYRRKGIASKLLQMAIDYMEKNDMVVSVLFGNQSIYHTLGWQPILYSVSHTKIDANLLNQDMGMSVKNASYKDLTESEKLQLRNIYAQMSRRFSGPIVRSKEYWETWVVDQSNSPWIIMGKNNSGEDHVIGYFSLNESADEIGIKEFIISDDFFPKMKNIFEWVIATVIKYINKPNANIYYCSALGSFGKIFKEDQFKDTMYKQLRGCSEEDAHALKLLKEEGQKIHLTWYTDRF